jgi:hypothetical protein
MGFLTLVSPIASPQDSTHLEKVAEGEYSQWQDGHPLKNTGLTWTVWRTKDGVEVEAKLPPNMAAFWAAGLKDMATPELRKEIQESSIPTNLDLHFTRQMAIQKLILDGVSLADQKHVLVADCRISDNEISCSGRGGTERRKNTGPEQLLYSYPFPLLFTPILRNYRPVQDQATPIKLVILEEVKNKLRLMEVSGQIQTAGTGKITIGEYTFDTEKYVVVLATKAGERKITLWTKNHETVFAMEDSLLVPGLRIMLNQYKRYSDF